MMGLIRPCVFSLPVLLFVLGSNVCAQPDNKIFLANLKQDFELLNREVTGLRSEVEMLRRENAQLRVVFEQTTRSQKLGQGSSLVQELQSRLQALELAFKQSEKARGLNQLELNKKFHQIIDQMNQGFAQVAKVNTSVSQSPSFSNDYPKNGFVHSVEKGETVSSIAQKYKSKVSWIINANQIVDPTKVFVGRELFVPQK